jgi:hypothetical protein
MLESENIVTLAVSEWQDQAEYAVETKSDHHEVMASVGAHNRLFGNEGASVAGGYPRWGFVSLR